MARTLLSSEDSNKPVEEMVQTATGKILVARQGDPRRPAIITYHDLGLNYLTNFQVSMKSRKSFVFQVKLKIWEAFPFAYAFKLKITRIQFAVTGRLI